MFTLFLCCAKSLPSQIEELRKTGKKGNSAAERCVAILEEIRREGLSGNFLFSKRTRRGEARVAKCIKYDLGNGYRLITIRCGDHLFIPFVGTHDKADLWLDHNRLEDIGTRIRLYTVEKVVRSPQEYSAVLGSSSMDAHEDEYEEDILNKVDDLTLRRIFTGLVESRTCNQ